MAEIAEGGGKSQDKGKKRAKKKFHTCGHDTHGGFGFPAFNLFRIDVHVQ
jgi:hypothetical protein